MPPKAPAGGGRAGGKQQAQGGGARKKEGGSSNADFLKADDVLQAVLLADSFQVKFRPLTQQKPKVLLPLLNIPMLEYSLEFLVSGGVGELFVFCSSHAAAIQAYLDSPETGSKWRRRKNLSIKCIVSDACASFGDAIRHLETLDIIKGDFVLISGDVISNVKLDAVVKEHKARVAQDKRNMMTLLFKQASHSHRTRSLADDAVLAIDPTTQQLLLYDNDRNSKRVELDKTLLTDSKQPIQLRYDLMDSHISVCTPEVLMLFADNFDWQTFHGDFLTGVLGSEILGNKLFVHTMRRDEYAARCDDLRTYDSLSKDIMHRWTYPIVPDNNLLGGFATSYKFHRGNIYKEDNVNVSREAKLGADSTIGAGTCIGARSFVDKSVIGRDCVIGTNVRITGSYIWGGVTIEDGAVIDRAILADGVVVRAGARVERGAILGFNVVIGAGFTVQPYTKITTARGDDEDGLELSDAESDGGDQGAKAKASAASSGDAEWNPLEVGPGGVGRVYNPSSEEEEEEEDEEEDGEVTAAAAFPYKLSELNSIAPNPQAVAAWLAASQYGAEESEDEWDEGVEEDDLAAEDDPALANQLGSGALNLHFHKFAHEVAETLKRGHDEKLPLDDISLEMSGLKFSHNTNVEEFAHATFLALFGLLNESVNPVGTKSAAPLDPVSNKKCMQTLGQLLKSWHPILAKFANKQADQVYMLAGLEQACLASGFVSMAPSPVAAVAASTSGSDISIYTPLFTPVLQLMYNNFSVFSEEAIIEWAQQAEDAEGDSHPLLVQSLKFREWLEEADEEEDEEDEDEE